MSDTDAVDEAEEEDEETIIERRRRERQKLLEVRFLSFLCFFLGTW